MFSVQNFRKTERKKWEFFKISKNGKRLLFKKKVITDLQKLNKNNGNSLTFLRDFCKNLDDSLKRSKKCCWFSAFSKKVIADLEKLNKNNGNSLTILRDFWKNLEWQFEKIKKMLLIFSLSKKPTFIYWIWKWQKSLAQLCFFYCQ